MEDRHADTLREVLGQEAFFSFSETSIINLITQVFITPVSTVLDAVSAATSGNAGTVSEENSITSPA